MSRKRSAVKGVAQQDHVAQPVTGRRRHASSAKGLACHRGPPPRTRFPESQRRPQARCLLAHPPRRARTAASRSGGSAAACHRGHRIDATSRTVAVAHGTGPATGSSNGPAMASRGRCASVTEASAGTNEGSVNVTECGEPVPARTQMAEPRPSAPVRPANQRVTPLTYAPSDGNTWRRRS
jgi:hypothetical protein